MFYSSKINLFLLPLLVSILLSTTGKLKVGRSIDTFVYAVLSPITSPVSKLHLLLENKYSNLANISVLQKEHLDQKNKIARLLAENEFLKQTVKDEKVLENLGNVFEEAIPVRLSGSSGKYLVSSSQSLESVLPGQPLVSGNVLLGIVKEVKSATVTITSLENEKSPSFAIRTASGHKGLYKFEGTDPKLIDVPSQTPLVLGDYIFTEPSDLFPGNLIVGKIDRLLTISQEPLQKAVIDLYDTLESIPDNLAIVVKP